MDPIRGVEKLMFRGLQGDLIRGARFAHIRATQAGIFVFFSYATVFALSVILSLIVSSFVLTLFLYVVWAGLGLVYIALGTKLAHNFAAWGICLAATLVSLGGIWDSIVRLSTDQALHSLVDQPVESPGVLVLQLIVFVVLATFFGFLTVVIARFISRMSNPVHGLPPMPLSTPPVPALQPTFAAAVDQGPTTSFAPHLDGAPDQPPLAPPPTTGQESTTGVTAAPPETYGWPPAGPVPVDQPSNRVVAVLASALFLVPTLGIYWLQEYAYQHIYGDLYDWLWPVLLTAPAVVLALAVLIRARTGRRLAAVAVAIVTAGITVALHAWATNSIFLSGDDRATWVYASTIIPTVGAVLAWGIARRRGAVWLTVVPLAGAVSALWTWIAWYHEPTSEWAWPLLGNWWGVYASDVWSVLAGILLAWLVDAATHRPPPPALPIGAGPATSATGDVPAFGATGPSSRSRSIGLLIGCVSIGIASAMVAVYVAEENSRSGGAVMGSPYSDGAHVRGGDYTEIMQPGPVTPSSVTAIRNADVGSCLTFEYSSPRRSDGTRPVSASTAPCTSDAKMVGSITTSPSLCSDMWIQVETPNNTIEVRCLLLVSNGQ